jgi:PAS domain S-box-containing protein
MAGQPLVDAALAIADIGTNVAGAFGLLLFARGFGRANTDAWLDAGSLGLLISLLIYDGLARTAQVGDAQSLADFAVATLDAVLFAILLRFIVRFLRNPGLLLLALVLGAAIVVDAVYAARGGFGPALPLALYQGVWLLAYTVIGAATLHPALRTRPPTRAPDTHELDHIARRVLVAVAIHTGSGVVALSVIALHVATGTVDALPVMLGGLSGLLALGTLRSVRVVRRLDADVAARLAAEALLRVSEQRYHNLAEVAPVGILEIDLDGRITASNRAWAALIGEAGTESGPASLIRTIHPDDAARVLATWDTALREVAPLAEEHRVLRPDGSTRWVRTAAVPLRDADGQRTGWVAAISDVTDLIEARTIALDREAIANGLQDQSPVGIEVYDVTGHTIRRNEAQRRIRGLAGLADSPSVDVRTDALTIALGQGPAIEHALVGETYPAEPESVRLTAIGRDGRTGEMWLRIRWFPLKGDDGRVVALISFTEDVSARVHAAADRQAAEVAVREAAKLEALGVLAGGIAHDFNNILVAILGHIGFAREAVPEGSAPAVDLAAAEQAAQRAADLARQMLAYSGHGTIQVGPMSLNAAAREMGSMVTSSLAPGAQLVFDLDETLPSVIADATQVRQIVLNLVVNASEALGGRAGTITIRTGLTTVAPDDPDVAPGTSAEAGIYAVLQVADTGIGMDAATVRRIFEPFFSTKKAGRGLGLAATLGIVKGHDGAIRVRSTPGQGTRFEILLRPDAVPLAPAAVAAAEPEARHGQAPVLLVDDEDGVRLIARRILERAGYGMVEAADGPEAITRFAEAPDRYAAVVLDLALPTMGGRAVLAELRNRRPGIPIVICSGWAADDVGDTLRASPHTVYLQKPFTPANLIGAVEQAMGAAAADDGSYEGAA